MSSKYSIELPRPPRSRIPDTNGKVSPVEVLITLLDGKTWSGELKVYGPSLNEIIILNSIGGDETALPINKVKTLQLASSRQFQLADEYVHEHADGLTVPPERQEFEIVFQDGSKEMGETLGHVVDHHGIHLFVAQAFYNYHHLFVPFTAMQDYRIGEYLGQMLVKRNVVTNEQIDQGLLKQQSLRQQKLGDILREEAIVTAEQLEQALGKQPIRPNMRLGEALVQDGLITEEQLQNALNKQKENRATPLGKILVDLGMIDEQEIQKTLASKLGIPFVNLRKFTVSGDVVKLVPEKIARRHMVMPLVVYDNKIVIAIENPMNRVPIEDIRFHTKMFAEPVMASSEDIEWAINQHYGAQINMLARELDIETADDDQPEFEVTDTDNALVKLVNKMIIDAYQQGASDIHIEPQVRNQKTLIRFRKDGTLKPYVELPYSYRNALVSRIKIMCDLDISERRKPQDGKIDFKKYGPAKIELRVATLPTAGGVEDVVMRVLANGEPIPLEQMGLNQRNLDEIRRLTALPYGLFLVCGPTGSGKTTTLHSILSKINTPDRKIWTAEDPVEITQTGLRQVQVNPKIGLNFANAMRSFLRADPDVIMVGEMRDEETTGMGIEASLTGHLVFSTLHTNSAPESVVRLLDMGMDPFNFADALLGVLAQRLAKRLCPICKHPHFATEEELHKLFDEYCAEICMSGDSKELREQNRQKTIQHWREKFANPEGEITLYTATGCEECGNSGYEGRIALHELLVASNTIKALIQSKSPVSQILLESNQEGMLTLKQDGIEKILQGQTDIHQVHAVCIK